MAAGLLAARLAGTGTRVESAGLCALVGRPADPLAVEVLRERGIDISAHTARQLTMQMVVQSDVVLVMERAQRRAIEAMCPAARGRIRLLSHARAREVADPYGRTRAAFEESLAVIEAAVDDLEAVLDPRRELRRVTT